MTDRASESVSVKRTIHVRVFCQRTRDHRDWIVAAIAMPRKFDAFRANQDVDTGPVKRRTKRIGMQCLAPLLVSFFVAMSTVFGGGKSAGLDKLVVHGGRVAWQRNIVLAEK